MRYLTGYQAAPILAGNVKYLGWVAQFFTLVFFERIKHIFLENIRIEENK